MEYLNEDDFVQTFGVLTGNQAVQHAKAGLKALYISGWQVVLPMPIRQAILILIKAYTQLIVCQRL